MRMPTQSRYVNSSLHLLFDDDHFRRRDGYLPNPFENGRFKFERRQHFFFLFTTKSGQIYRRFELKAPGRWCAVFSMKSISKTEAYQSTEITIGGLHIGVFAYSLYQVDVDYPDAWESDMLELLRFGTVIETNMRYPFSVR